MDLKPTDALTMEEIAALPKRAPPSYHWTLAQAQTQDPGFVLQGVHKLREFGGDWFARVDHNGVEKSSSLWRDSNGNICASFTGLRNMHIATVGVILRAAPAG